MRAINNSAEYEQSVQRMEELLKVVGSDTDPLSEEFQELDKLSDRIADYEELNYSFSRNN